MIGYNPFKKRYINKTTHKQTQRNVKGIDWIEMPTFLLESEMELFLTHAEFDIYDHTEENCIDSTEVLNIADCIGYEYNMNSDSIFEFWLHK